MNTPLSKPVARLATGLLILLAAAVDYLTGIEIRVLPLYLLPLLLAGWTLGQVEAVLAALLTTAGWLATTFAESGQMPGTATWAINGFADGLVFVFVALLVARLRSVLERERLLGRTDPLTGLANRRSFVDLASVGMTLCRRHRRPVSLAYLDLDNFKQANDSFGHHRGDELLRQCAQLISGCVRASDAVARLGGDEFAVFLPETDAETAAVLIERMRHAIDTAPDFQGAAVTASIGVVSEPHADLDIQALLSRADAQMYEAKRRGRSRPAPGAADRLRHADGRPMR